MCQSDLILVGHVDSNEQSLSDFDDVSLAAVSAGSSMIRICLREETLINKMRCTFTPNITLSYITMSQVGKVPKMK